MSSIEWAEPPTAYTHSRIFTQAVINALREAPNRWARVAVAHKSATVLYAFRQAHAGFETRSVRNPDGTFDLYARFVGEVAS